MTAINNRIAGRARLTILAVGPGLFCMAAPAHADTRWGATVSAGGSVETHPYLVNGGGADASLSLDVQPWVQLARSDLSSLDLAGSLSLRQYTKSANGTDISGTASLLASSRVSSYLNVNGSINYYTSLNGINQGFAVVGPNDPPPPPNTLLPDVSLAGTRTRTQSIAANVGASARLSPLDSLGMNLSATRYMSDSSIGRDFNTFSGGLNYSRTLNARLSLTASASYSKSNYLGTHVGDGSVITAQAGVDARLSPILTLNFSIGASFTRNNAGSGAVLNSTSLTGQVRLCRAGERSSFCLGAAYAPQPNALGSIGSTLSITAGYNKTLSAKDSLTFNLSYTANKNNPSIVGPKETSKYWAADGSLAHRFTPRFSGYLSPGYSRVSDFSRSYNSFRISAGLRYTLGAIS